MSIVRNDLQILSALEGAFSVTPSDVTDFPRKSTGLYVGVSGNVSVVMANGNEVTMVGLAAGVWHPLQIIRVNATNTTATNILAGY